MYTVVDGKIVNDSGEIAVRWNRLTQKYVKIGVREYIFAIRSNISLAWIHPEDIDKVLALKATCCGGNLNIACHLASELDVKRWTGVSIW